MPRHRSLIARKDASADPASRLRLTLALALAFGDPARSRCDTFLCDELASIHVDLY